MTHLETSPFAAWTTLFPASITVSDTAGVILWMNEAAIEHYASFGGRALIGTNMLDCHPEPARAKVAKMLENPAVSVYTIEKRGKRSLVHHSTWYEGDRPSGLVEMIIDLPDEVRNVVRAG